MKSFIAATLITNICAASVAHALDLNRMSPYLSGGGTMEVPSFQNGSVKVNPSTWELSVQQNVKMADGQIAKVTEGKALANSQKFELREMVQGNQSITGTSDDVEVWSAQGKGEDFGSLTMCFEGSRCITATKARCEKALFITDDASVFELVQRLTSCSKAMMSVLKLDEGAKAASEQNISRIQDFHSGKYSKVGLRAGEGSKLSEVDVMAGQFMLHFAQACSHLFGAKAASLPPADEKGPHRPRSN